MTPLPKRKLSSRRQGRRRANHKAAFKALQKCPNCGNLAENHKACKHCGFYKGRQVKKINQQKASK